MRYANVLLFCLSLLCSSSALAFAVGEISVPLTDRSGASIKTAEQAALTQLLVQLTGRAEVSALPGVSGLLADPQRWLSQYGYGRSASGGETLVAHFDADALSRALLASGAPVWSLSRPPVLLWLATPAGLVASGDGEVLQANAVVRGLPLTLPANSNEVAPADVRGRFMQSVFSASQVYGTDLVASAVIYQGSPMQVRWWLYQKQQLLTQGQGSAADMTSVQALLINQLTDAIASRYAVQGGTTGSYALSVKGVSSLVIWKGLNQYLLSLAGVSQVATRRVAATQVDWTLAFAGSADQLTRLLTVNRHLSSCASTPDATTAADTATPATPAVADALTLCWQP